MKRIVHVAGLFCPGCRRNKLMNYFDVEEGLFAFECTNCGRKVTAKNHDELIEAFKDKWTTIYPSKSNAHLITEADFANNPNVDERGFLPAWVESRDGDCFWGTVDLKQISEREPDVRYRTEKPTPRQMTGAAWV